MSHLQFNPRLQPYDFWPLVADSTVIVQHVCAVALFVCCFVGIYQERVSPVSVVGSATACSVGGWIVWDTWLGADEGKMEKSGGKSQSDGCGSSATSTSEEGGVMGPASGRASSAALTPSTAPSRAQSPEQPRASTPVVSSSSPNLIPYHPPWPPAPSPLLTPRNQQRLATAKSALLIYCALLGLSPILKSLTKSTSSDSIWAMSCWLLIINVFFFDYGGGLASQFPASLSTNAALMASTVLASRLPATTHVFSLTLFSIQVFGLFPVFRRQLRHRSFALHVCLTVALILAAGAGLGVTLVGGGVWKAGILGMFVWGLGSVVVMGGSSWWLIGLQRYKNVVIGPWDPARPVIRAATAAWD